MFEESSVFKIKDVPLVINISSRKYVLFGLIVFHSPLSENDIGHYSAAIRLNNRWEMYDGLRSKPFSVSAGQEAVIHCIFYVKFDSEDNTTNSIVNHSDVS